MSNYDKLKLTYQGGREKTITLTGNTIDYEAYLGRHIVAVEVPEIVQTISDYAFCDNNDLANIVLNEGLQRIEGQAFQHGVYTAVTIPSTVTYIGWNAFNTSDEQGGDQHTFTLTCLATTPPTLVDDEGITFGDPQYLSAIYVPDGSVSAYQEAWPAYASKIQGVAGVFSNLNIKAAYVGDVEVVKMYLGDDVVWGGSEPEPIYSAMPLTFNIISAGTILWRAQDTAYTTTIEYSLDSGETWTSTTSNTGDSAPSISVNAGDVVQFRGDNATYATGTSKYNCFCGSTAIFEAKGNIMSLIYSTGFETATTLTDKYAFLNLFRSCTGLTSAENLVLPATTLADNCYEYMFYVCRSLVTAPELPATTLAKSCYSNMFTGCRSLVTAPTLPATTLAQYCYTSMFNSCTSLTQAPELPATTLAQYCYTSMFYDCTSLTQAPELPATTLASICYAGMFYDCTSLTQAPELPATTLASYCYNNMFYECTNLTTAPVLPATTLAKSCYSNMFYGCTSLTSAPALPATTLANSCYYGMFQDCTSLTSAPELPATTLTDNCYVDMFRNCASLNYIKALITSPVSSNLKRWVTGVASSGTFVKHPNATWTTGDDGIPSGWTVVDADI